MKSSFVKEIEKILEEKSLLNHPFYQMWSHGKLSQETLAEYAREYYPLEKAFPSFLLQSKEHVPDKESEAALMENFSEETAPGQTHEGMWLDFAQGLGMPRQKAENSKILPSTQKVLDEFSRMTKSSWFAGIGAMLAYEANLQKTSATKIEGLKKFYGITNPKALKFFKVHGVLDIKHSDEWKTLLDKAAKTAEQQEETKKAVSHAMGLLWGFLDGINEKFNANCAC